MRTVFFKRSLVAILLLCSWAPCFAQTTPRANALSSPEAIDVLQDAHLQDQNTFVEQSELDSLIDKDGGGACASAAAIDVLQVLRLMAGLEKLPNPHKIALKSFANSPSLLQGRVSNEQLVELLSSYESYLAGNGVLVSVTSAPKSKYGHDAEQWDGRAGPDLRVEPRQVKLLSYTVTEQNGEIAGRHFVLLQGLSDADIVVLDQCARQRLFLSSRPSAGSG